MDEIREAYEAFATGDVEPLVRLMHHDMEWRGRRAGASGARLLPDAAPGRPGRFSSPGSRGVCEPATATFTSMKC
jgi:hypothetical protein